jgi:putative hydrolase of the HAD superfamily
MAGIRVLFWDVGGVLLTNAWDHEERNQAIQHFALNREEFETRHKEIVPPFEEGRVGLDEYLQHTILYQQRCFTSSEFKQFMFDLSQPKTATLEIANNLSRNYLMGTINNESRELNAYRIQRFALTDVFNIFVSSCFVGMRKPEERIYRLALDLTQVQPDECCFIDDRPVNIEAAGRVGMKTVLMQNPEQLKENMRRLGIQL